MPLRAHPLGEKPSRARLPPTPKKAPAPPRKRVADTTAAIATRKSRVRLRNGDPERLAITLAATQAARRLKMGHVARRARKVAPQPSNKPLTFDFPLRRGYNKLDGERVWFWRLGKSTTRWERGNAVTTRARRGMKMLLIFIWDKQKRITAVPQQDVFVAA